MVLFGGPPPPRARVAAAAGPFAEARDAVAEPIFQGPGEQRRTELFGTVFHGLVNLLVELFALTAAFVFFLSGESTRVVQNQIISSIDQPELLRSASRAVQSAFDAACAASRTAASGTAALPDCCAPGAGSVAAVSGSLRTLLDLASPPGEVGGDAAQVQNLWVMRVAVLFCALGLLALVVAYFVTRIAGGPRVPLGRIVLYNVLLFIFAFAVQVAFMGIVTLRYVPILPSDQLRALREAVAAEELVAATTTAESTSAEATTLAFARAGAATAAATERAETPNQDALAAPSLRSETQLAPSLRSETQLAPSLRSETQPAPSLRSETHLSLGVPAGAPATSATTTVVSASSILPASATVSTALTLAMIAVVAAILFLAWRARAFRIVSTVQGLCVQLGFIFAVMVVVYFWLSGSIGAELQANAIRETVGYVSQIARKTPSGGVAGDTSQMSSAAVWAAVRESLDARAENVEEQDRAVLRRNQRVTDDMRLFATVAGGLFAAVVLLTALARRQATHWRFWLALLLVGLVGGSTTLLVEYGFAQNVLRNYRPVSAPQLARGLAGSFAAGVERHAQWFCQDSRCGDAARAVQNTCCAPGSSGPVFDPTARDRMAKRITGIPPTSAARDVVVQCTDPAVWNLDDLYVEPERWLTEAMSLVDGNA